MRGFLDEHAGGVLECFGQGAAAGFSDKIGVDGRRRVGCVAGASVRAGGRDDQRVEQVLGECRGGAEEDEWGDR